MQYWVLLLLVSTLPYINKGMDRTWLYLMTMSITGCVCWLYLVNFRSRNTVVAVIKNLKHSPHFVFYCLCLVGSQAGLMFFHGEGDLESLVRTAGYVIMATIAYILLPVAVGPHRLRKFWAALMVIGMGCSFLGLLVIFGGKNNFLGLVPLHVLKPTVFSLYSTSGPFFEPNMFAAVLAMGVVGSLYFISRREYVFLTSLTICMCSICIFFTLSRAAYLGGVLALGTWLWIPGKLSQRIKLFLLGGVLSAVGLYIISHNLAVYYFLDLSHTGTRSLLWSSALQAILSRPLTGYGMGGENLYRGMALFGGLSPGGDPYATHNAFFDIGVQAGVGASLAFFITSIISLLRLLRSDIDVSLKRTIGAGIVFMLTATNFQPYSLGGAAYAALTMTILLGLGNAAPVMSRFWQEDRRKIPKVRRRFLLPLKKSRKII